MPEKTCAPGITGRSECIVDEAPGHRCRNDYREARTWPLRRFEPVCAAEMSVWGAVSVTAATGSARNPLVVINGTANLT